MSKQTFTRGRGRIGAALAAWVAIAGGLGAPVADARFGAGASIQVTALEPSPGANDDTILYRFEVVNQTGKPLKDFHLDPDDGQPKGNPMDPKGVSGTWSKGKGDGAFNWATTGAGIPDGGTATFVIEVKKSHSRESRGTGIGTDDGDLDPRDGKVAEDDTHGIPARG